MGDLEEDRPQPTSPRPPLSRDTEGPRGAEVGGGVQSAAGHSGAETRRGGDPHNLAKECAPEKSGEVHSKCFVADLTQQRVKRPEFNDKQTNKQKKNPDIHPDSEPVLLGNFT